MLASNIMLACRSLCFTSCGIYSLCTLPNNITQVCRLSRDFPSLLQVQAAKLTPLTLSLLQASRSCLFCFVVFFQFHHFFSSFYMQFKGVNN